MRRSALCFVLVLAAIAALTTSAVAQPQPPRTARPQPGPGRMGGPGLGPNIPPDVFAPGDELVPDFRLWLRGLNQKQLPKDVDPKLLKELVEKLEKLPKDQQPGEKDIKELLEKNPQFKDPAFLKQLNELAKDPHFPEKLEGKLPQDTPPIQNEDNLKSNLEKVLEQANKQPTIPEGGPKGDPLNPPKVDPPQVNPPKVDPKATSPANENEWAKWLEKNFGDSPSGQAALKDLLSALEKPNVKGMFDQMPEFKNGAMKDLDSWGKANAGELWKVKPPDLSGNKATSPKIGGSGGPSWGSGGSGGASGFGGAGGVGFGGGGTVLAVIVGAAGAILLAILLFRKWKLNQAERAAAHAAGSPGIDFDSIRTRDELVRAFDHVSLDQIGEEARSWNHRVIADQLADARPAQAEPAGELAGLYERARYAPLDEDLTSGEFADARRDLRVIAGVPA